MVFCEAEYVGIKLFLKIHFQKRLITDTSVNSNDDSQLYIFKTIIVALRLRLCYSFY
jgi:hypothetical protein